MDVFLRLQELVRQDRQIDIVTIIEGPMAVGQMLLVGADGQPEGILVDSSFTLRVLAEMKGMNWQKPLLLAIRHEGEYRLFWERLTPAPSVLVLGAGHISQPVVELLSLTGYEVTVIDDRPEYADPRRFPKADQVICQGFSRALEEVAARRFTAAIIVTRGHRYDLECLRVIMTWPLAYLGMIGSRRRVRGIKELLLQEGVDPDRLEKLKAPIGIDLGGQTPGEIALSIVAEVIGTLKKGTYLPLSVMGGGKDG